METQRIQMQRLYDAGTEISQAPLMVNPNLPLQSSLPSLQGGDGSPSTNAPARTTSRKRRPSGTGHAKTPIESFPQPPAPEVPKGPPLSYRPPHGPDSHSPSEGNYPASFAERARALTGKSLPAEPPDFNPEPLPHPARPERRGSLNRPIGGLYSEIQKHKRDSYPPRKGPISPRRSSNPASPQPFESRSGNPASRKDSSTTAQQYEYMNGTTPPSRNSSSVTDHQPPETASRVIQPGARRVSASATQTQRKEWAPEHSPLQKLEAELTSKERKRARVEAAEQKLRESQARDRQHESVRGGDFAEDPITSRRHSTTTGTGKTRTRSNQTEANRLEGNREQLIRDSQAQRTSGRIISGSHQPLSLSPIGKTFTRSTEKVQLEQQQGRGVRFQGEEDTEDLGASSSDMDKAESLNRRRSWGMDALAKSDAERAARRNKSRQDPAIVAKRTPSRDVPIEQQELYTSRMEKSIKDTSVADHRAVTDSVPRHAVQGPGQATSHESAPQTAAGIQARQMVGFGSESQGVVQGKANRKHHLSTILHRDHSHTANVSKMSNARPKKFDEWKQGGTARLTAADFVTGKESEDKDKTWWEESRSDSRRKLGRARQPQQSHQDNNGKLPSSIAAPTQRSGESPSSERVIRTRQYVGHEQFPRIKKHSESSHESHASHFFHRVKNEQFPPLSSVYSYSCTNLADHDPAHFEHICEPYLSKELTLGMRSIRIRPAPALTTFNPPLYLKCGPLLRYTGMKRDRLQMQTRSGPSSSERETWRGSVMIVTADADSSYDPPPTLRLFPEAMDLLHPPSQRMDAEDGHNFPTEYMDPIAGLPKLTRSGKTVYVKPVDDLEQGVDLSRFEDDDGLFEEFRTAAVPTAYGTPDFHPGRSNGTSQANPKTGGRGQRASKRGQKVGGIRLYADRGVTFWRFNLEVELSAKQTRVAYSINGSPSVGFWIPGRGQSMNVMFHSCNGFSMSVK